MIFILNLISTLFLTGLIWTIQIVHYPLFSLVGEKEFIAYHSAHSSQISKIVIPLMLLELISTLLNCFYIPFAKSNDFEFKILNYSGILFVIIVWFSTFLLSVPEHNVLANGWNNESIQKLVITNWVRTIVWTFHSFLLVYQLKVKLGA
ncbi:MAG: hypothetical protein IPL26_26060 [Leptospiraceae bacterium]|nr:hypothetical protein [Leptospiraceae bacterium]